MNDRTSTDGSSTRQGGPRVSIVIPTYRRPHFLQEALATAVAQTERSIEILVCDNGADEETADVVRRFDDPRIVHIRRHENIGMFANAVDGFRRARGDFVLKLDDDDRLAPHAVERLLVAADHDVTLAFAPFDLIDADGHLLERRTQANERHSGRSMLSPGPHRPFDHLVASGAVGLACALVRRDAVDWHAVPADVATAYDRHLALQAARDGATAWFVDEPLAQYRIHLGSDTAQAYTRQSLGSLHAMEHALESGRHADRTAVLDGTQESAVWAARHLLRDGQVRDARRLLIRAVCRRPDLPLWRLLAVALLPAPAARRLAQHRLHRYERAHPEIVIADASRRPPQPRRQLTGDPSS